MCNYLSILRLEESVSINQFSLILSIRWLSPPPPLSHAFVICIRIVSEMAMTSFETSKASDKVYPLQWRHNARDGVLNHQPYDCLLNRLFRGRSKKTSKLRVTGLCKGNSTVTGEFPAQRASYAENVSIWWCHHDWFCIIEGLSRSSESNFIESAQAKIVYEEFEKYTFKTRATSPRNEWVKKKSGIHRKLITYGLCVLLFVRIMNKHHTLSIPAWISNYFHYKVQMILLIHSQTSMVQPLTLRNG